MILKCEGVVRTQRGTDRMVRGDDHGSVHHEGEILG
jgi:hypothetical protein